jgi:Glycosyltransferase family 87
VILGRRARAAAVVGVLLFVASCLLPRYGLGARRLDTSLFQLYGERTLDGKIPYRDFSLEYPPGALPAFVLPALAPSADYGLWFKVFEAVSGAACVAAVAAVLDALRVGARDLWAGVVFAALAPLALGPLTLVRFDLWPTALAAVGLAAVLAGRERIGFGALGFGTAAKLFPLALVPLAALYVARRRGAGAARRGLVVFAVVLALVVLPFAMAGPGGLRFSVERQAGRALQIESVGAAGLLVAHELGGYSPKAQFGSGSWNLVGPVPRTLAALETGVELVALLLVWIAYARSRRSPGQLVLASAAALSVAVVFGRVLSPQFLLWLVAPLAVLLGRRAIVPAALLVVSMVLTRMIYPARYDALVAFESTPVWLLAARDALLVALVAQIGIASRRKYAESATATTRAS